MEVYNSIDGKVTKYIHTDGSETAIKTVSSCNNVINMVGGLTTQEVDKEKFSVFMSSSVGCPLGCKFCHLTINKYPYRVLTEAQIMDNFKEALEHKISEEPALRKKYIKLAWMGMGDAFLRDPYDVRKTSIKMLRHAIGNVGIHGIDGVDIGTVLPQCKGWKHQLGSLDDDLRQFRVNPNNTNKRSRVRLFYSLVSTRIRELLIPINQGVVGDLNKLYAFNDWYNIDVILHSFILKDLNDSNEEVEDTITMLYNFLPDAELRILRYNKDGLTDYEESPKFLEVAKKYTKELKKVKIQTSAGKDVSASCGMFMCKKEFYGKDKM